VPVKKKAAAVKKKRAGTGKKTGTAKKKAAKAPRKKTAASKESSPAARKKKSLGGRNTSSGKKGKLTGNRAEKALAVARAALDKKALDLEILDMGALVYYADYFVICSATSTQHVAAVADNIEKQLGRLGHRASSIEGRRNALWVLIDLGDVVVHVFEQETRQYYQLGKLWLDAPRIKPPAPVDALGGGSG
jgi:ribosome-associated protein